MYQFLFFIRNLRWYIQNQIIIQLQADHVNKHELPYMGDSIKEMLGK